MSKILQLEHYYFSKVNAVWNDGDEELKPNAVAPQLSHALKIDYDVRRNVDDEHLYAMVLRVDAQPAEANGRGMSVSTEIVGVFRSPEGMSLDQAWALVRVNGGAILYGVLRGELAGMTGSFPPGRHMLPTVNFADIVLQHESRLEREEAKQRKRKARPKKTPPQRGKHAR